MAMRENLQSFLMPGKLYFKQGSLPIALAELKYELKKSRVFMITDPGLMQSHVLDPVTGALFNFGIDYSLVPAIPTAIFPCRKYAPDCIIAVGSQQALELAASVREQDDPNLYFITIPTTVGKTQTAPLPDMVIVDEDMIAQPDENAAKAILQTARESLKGANASDYTLGFAVKAMRIVFSGAKDKTSLLRAASLAENAKSIAFADGGEGEDLLADAADSLGMTADALLAKLS